MTYLPLLLSLHRSLPSQLLPLIQPLYPHDLVLSCINLCNNGLKRKGNDVFEYFPLVSTAAYTNVFSSISTTSIISSIPSARPHSFHGWHVSEHCSRFDVFDERIIIQFGVSFDWSTRDRPLSAILVRCICTCIVEVGFGKKLLLYNVALLIEIPRRKIISQLQ